MEHTETSSTDSQGTPFVPALQLTQGQPAPIADNGGLSYMSFDRGGDAGTNAATEAALAQIATGKGRELTELLENSPPGPIETKWGIGVRRYSECLEYIRANDIKAPEGGLALPLPYTVHEEPSYSIVSSNALWSDPDRQEEAKAEEKKPEEEAPAKKPEEEVPAVEEAPEEEPAGDGDEVDWETKAEGKSSSTSWVDVQAEGKDGDGEEDSDEYSDSEDLDSDEEFERRIEVARAKRQERYQEAMKIGNGEFNRHIQIVEGT